MPSDRPTVLVLDREPAIRLALRARLTHAGYRVVEAGTVRAARSVIPAGVDVALIDHRLDDGSGLELLAEMTAAQPDLPAIVLSSHASVSQAVSAMKAGAFHFAVKPVDLEEIVLLVQNALETRPPRRAGGQPLPGPRDDGTTREWPIVGDSPQMHQVHELLARIATSPGSTVLVTGESGTGKDLAARAIHTLSQRARGPFLNITCSALPGPLLESELFGHERGAFTDARQRKIGLLEHADGGTVFLDEIGEMALELQAKLLRFLDDKSFRRVGGNAQIRADVRIVAATNIDLREAVQHHAFREDLYYRLAVLMLRLPPLREREGDAEILAHHFLGRFNQEFGRAVRGIDAQARELVRTHSWPGNVRELKNALERAVLLARSDVLSRRDFDTIAVAPADKPTFELPAGGIDIRDVERSFVKQALERTRGNRTRAAKLLGINRDQIRYRIEHFGLEIPPRLETAS